MVHSLVGDAEFQNLTRDYRRYVQIYETPQSVDRYCGTPTDSEDWGTACNERLFKIHWARMQRVYQLVDYADVQQECAAYPERCDLASNLERVVLGHQVDAANQRRAQQFAAIDAQQAWDEDEWARDQARALEVSADMLRGFAGYTDRVCEVTPTANGGYVQRCSDR